jgi:hypothetical protein
LTQDIGPAVCEEIRIAMNTDEPEYHEPLERGYRWWPHRLCQRVEGSLGFIGHPPYSTHNRPFRPHLACAQHRYCALLLHCHNLIREQGGAG